MPSEKRRRQDEGRMARRVAENTATKKQQRNRTVRNLGGILVALIAVAFLVSVLGKDDKKSSVDATASTTTIPGDPAGTTPPSTPTAPINHDPGPAVGDSDCPPADGSGAKVATFASGPKADCLDVSKTYTAKFSTTKGDFTVVLDPKAAPKTVNSFVFLARNHFYDGVGFHRIIPGFVVQGGDPTGSGSGGPGYEFADELPTGSPAYELGSLAMANSGTDTNGSQFFVVTGDQGVNLPAKYSKFGKVTEGMDVVKAIEATGSEAGTPSEPTTMNSVTITES